MSGTLITFRMSGTAEQKIFQPALRHRGMIMCNTFNENIILPNRKSSPYLPLKCLTKFRFSYTHFVT